MSQMESCSCARFVTQKLPLRVYIQIWKQFQFYALYALGLFWAVSVEMSLLPKFKTFTSIVGFVQYCPKQTLTMKTILNHMRTRKADQSSTRNHVPVIFRE